ncbi:MAG: ribokinase [Candidatus Sulfotelmatobacter sp.]
MQKPIVVVGSINFDLVVGADHIPQVGETIIGDSFNTFYGGKGANQAVAVAKLGYPLALVGNVGNDAFGNQLRSGLEYAGVDTTYVNTVEGASGIALITTGRAGENNIVVVPGANGHITPKQLEKAETILEYAGFFLTQLEIPLETVEYLAQFAERHKIPLMLDPAPARELPGSLLRKVSWITPNETETEELLKTRLENNDQSYYAAAESLLDRGVKNVLLKLGSHGCLIAQGSLAKERIPAFSVNAEDTTGAGDAFNAGFAVGLMRGSTVAQSAVFASAVAAISVTRRGAQPSMPTSVEVKDFVNEHLGPQVSFPAVELSV